MRVVGFVLAGGLGTRLRPYTFVLPKPLIPLGDSTILERVLLSLSDSGIHEVAVSVGHLGHLIEAVIGDGRRFGVNVRYTREESPLGTAGALALLPFPLDDDDILLVVNGDTLTDLDFATFVTWFDRSGADAAMACVSREVQIDYGVVTIGPDGDLASIDEKPSHVSLLSTGINAFRGRSLRGLDGSHVDMPAFLQSLVESGSRVACYTLEGLWMDLGRPDDLANARELVEGGSL